MATKTPQSRFPFVQDIVEQGFGTLYVLCDDPVRLRDSISVVALVRFFAGCNVRLDVQPVLAKHRRFLSERDVTKFLGNAELADRLAVRPGSAPLQTLVHELFLYAETHSEPHSADQRVPVLAPRGPIVVLGRPQIYPPAFRAQIEGELGGVGKMLVGRFEMPYHDDTPGAEIAGLPDSEGFVDRAFWTVHDTYYKMTYVAEPQRHRDHGIVRKVRGAFARRTFLFAYGTSSLGTYGAAQMLIDEDQNARLQSFEVEEHLERWGELEILIEVNRGGAIGSPPSSSVHEGDLTPAELRVSVGPSPPVSGAAKKWIAAFTGDGNDALLPAYGQPTTVSNEPAHVRFVCSRHPADGVATRMVGGADITNCVKTLRRHVVESQQVPILLVGPTGVGKELAARVIYEQRVLALLRELRAGDVRRPAPAVVGARFKAINCAGMTETMAESQLFGIAHDTASFVSAKPGAILAAGEGVVFLDEIHFMDHMQQARLLRAIQHPFQITPLGSFIDIPCSAQIVAAMSTEPEELVLQGRMLPELLNRFRECIVRIPPLAARPGDVPALLAAMAGKSILMDELVLRRLLADPHTANARGLGSIFWRARGLEEQSTGPSSSVLQISLAALGGSVELDQFHGPAARCFEFELAPATLLPFEIFQDVARVLTSLTLDAERRPALRPADADTLTNLGTRQLNFANVDAAATLWGQSILQIKQLFETAEGHLRAMGCLYEMRFGEGQAEEFGVQLLRARERLGGAPERHPGRNCRDVLYNKDLALSLSVDPARVTEWGKRYRPH